MSTNNNSNNEQPNYTNYLYLVVVSVISFSGGYFLSQMQTKPDERGDRIATIAIRNKATIAPLIGNTGKFVGVNPLTGELIKDCTKVRCRAKVVIGQDNEPTLIDRRTNEPIQGVNKIDIVHFDYRGSYCDGYWSLGTYIEFCWD
jgi:hypothetical protein